MARKTDILLIDPMPDSFNEQLGSPFRLHRFTTVEALGDLAERIEGVATGGGSGLPRPIMDALPNLKVISVNGVGIDRIDLDECRRRSIRLATAQGVLTDDVADMAIGLMIDATRGLSAGDRFVRAGKWGHESEPLSHTLKNRKLGIVGFGAIGKAVARRAAAFDMTIAYFSSREQTDTPQYPFYPTLDVLADWADILILCVSGGARSHNMIDRSILSALGPDGILVNVARGSVVDEPALLQALQDGTIRGAGLDVFADEPHVPEAFFTLENVVLQGHRASATCETRMAMGRLVFDNLAAFFDGRPLLTPVL
ncbi:2-hydroxyacid dehydrogenase [Swaminathania salitolerans]|uniref:Dehydrogenase n=1 Tax=Swaminathania salitolerans TaxID=182838 RepID=A0A511BQW5_9PROT|nr:2-hydroxyacid dehydrogenase [Swaminathania salitolerans]GBQ12069.1 D-isomer-specific 2-hydroxyacid dehydrogenase [Swaminathania salitolerans LMG 21291]GEL02720.1 dehydrogenase [Swaminathania salitolerans]